MFSPRFFRRRRHATAASSRDHRAQRDNPRYNTYALCVEYYWGCEAFGADDNVGLAWATELNEDMTAIMDEWDGTGAQVGPTEPNLNSDRNHSPDPNPDHNPDPNPSPNPYPRPHPNGSPPSPERSKVEDVDEVSVFAAYMMQLNTKRFQVDFFFDENFGIDNPKTESVRAECCSARDSYALA